VEEKNSKRNTDKKALKLEVVAVDDGTLKTKDHV
jgi:hypothetical protein